MIHLTHISEQLGRTVQNDSSRREGVTTNATVIGFLNAPIKTTGSSGSPDNAGVDQLIVKILEVLKQPF